MSRNLRSRNVSPPPNAGPADTPASDDNHDHESPQERQDTPPPGSPVHSAVGNDDPDDLPRLVDDDEDDDLYSDAPTPANDLAQVIAAMGDTITASMREVIANTRATPVDEPRGSEPKANTPEHFDGSSRRKLDVFIAECEILFETSPRRYRTDRSKVLASGSYLKGNAKEWFTNSFKVPRALRPDWLLTWDAYCEKLQEVWGLQDPGAAAEAELRKLSMSNSERVPNYIARFSIIQPRLSHWGERNLRNEFHRGLAPRIRKQWTTAGRTPPERLTDMMADAEQFDRAYWAEVEVARLNGETGDANSQSRPANSLNPRSSNKGSDHRNSTSTSGKSTSTNPRSHNSGSRFQPKSHTTSTPKSKERTAEPAYKKHLGPDGKLTPEERQRRVDNGLCLFCGKPGHSATNCRQKTPDFTSTSTNKSVSFARATVTVQPNEANSKSKSTETTSVPKN